MKLTLLFSIVVGIIPSIAEDISYKEVEEKYDMRHKQQHHLANKEVILEKSENAVSLNISIGGGYRVDNLQWSIGSTATPKPNVLSELTWSDIQIAQFMGKGILTIENVLFTIEVSRGEIVNGSVQDSDFKLDDRNGEFLRSIADNNDDNVIDISGSTGVYFDLDAMRHYFKAEDMGLTLQIGASYHEQNLRMTNGVSIIDKKNNNNGSFFGLNTTYQTEWVGPWLGMEWSGNRSNLSTSLQFQVHFFNYEGQGNWNLRKDFQHPVSFRHTGNGIGLTFGLNLAYQLTEHWGIAGRGRLESWKIADGTSTVFLSDGTIATIGLREVDFQSASVALEAIFSF